MFLTSRNIGNVFSQTSVIAVVALGQLLVIITRGIDLSVGSTIALSGVVGAIVFEHTSSSVLVIAAILGTGLAVGARQWAGLRLRARAASVHRHARHTQHRAGACALGFRRNAHPRDAADRQTIGGGTINWIPYSIFVVAGVAIARSR